MSLFPNTESMTPEERSEYIWLRRWGLLVLVFAIVFSMGLTAGLWSSMGSTNAIRIGIAAFSVPFIVGGTMLKIAHKMATNENKALTKASATAAVADAFAAPTEDV